MRKISFEEFDQTPGKGWRALEAIGKFKEAGDIIIAYITNNPEINKELASAQLSLLWFHAGQMHAMCNDYETAIRCFINADKDNALGDILGPTANNYLQATIAFLKGDNSAVMLQLEEILQVPLADYPPGRFVFIPGRVHDMYEHPNMSYHDICNRSFKLPPLHGETQWLIITPDDLDHNSEKARDAAKEYNINFQRSSNKK